MPTYIVDKRQTYNSNILHLINSKMHLIKKKYFPNQVAFHIYTQTPTHSSVILSYVP